MISPCSADKKASVKTRLFDVDAVIYSTDAEVSTGKMKRAPGRSARGRVEGCGVALPCEA